ncbi:MAG TPA: DUF2281 domain-containing protein [Roseiflexaceae bacterium]
MITTTEKPLADLVRDLPPDLEAEIRNFVEFLIEKRQSAERAELERRAIANGWPTGYFEQTAGSLPDFPDVDGDMSGIDPSVDRTEENLRFDPLEERDSQGTAE